MKIDKEDISYELIKACIEKIHGDDELDIRIDNENDAMGFFGGTGFPEPVFVTIKVEGESIPYVRIWKQEVYSCVGVTEEKANAMFAFISDFTLFGTYKMKCYDDETFGVQAVRNIPCTLGMEANSLYSSLVHMSLYQKKSYLSMLNGTEFEGMLELE